MFGLLQIRHRLIVPALLVLVLAAGGQATVLSSASCPHLQAAAVCHAPILSHARPASRWNASTSNKRVQPAMVSRKLDVRNEVVGGKFVFTLSARLLGGAFLDQRGRSPPVSL